VPGALNFPVKPSTIYGAIGRTAEGQRNYAVMTNATPTLVIENLHVSVEGKEILKGVSLTVNQGEIHALMGPNGSGKSTLASTIMGHPKYTVTSGDIRFRGESILNLPPDERARRGLFLSMQYPVAIPGVTLVNFMRRAVSAVRGTDVPVREFTNLLTSKMSLLKVDREFARRYVNEGFSGGEKKKAEILQLAMLQPKIAVLDETDSGLDIDALKIVANGVNTLRSPDRAIVVVTHYQRLLNHIIPDYVHVLAEGRIVKSGDKSLALELEQSGYVGIEEFAETVR
jgi:Fe-S cluster assembly ATP-binding protein